MNRWLEIFEDDSGRLSSTRLCMVIGVLTLSAVLFMLVFKDTKEVVGVATIFATMVGAVTSIGKVSDNNVKKASMNPDPVPIAPQPNVPAMVINNAPQG